MKQPVNNSSSYNFIVEYTTPILEVFIWGNNNRCLLILSRIQSRCAHTIEKESMKSTVTFLAENLEEGQDIPPYVTRYSSRGFRIKNIKVFGSVAIVPDTFYHWKVWVVIVPDTFYHWKVSVAIVPDMFYHWKVSVAIVPDNLATSSCRCTINCPDYCFFM